MWPGYQIVPHQVEIHTNKRYVFTYNSALNSNPSFEAIAENVIAFHTLVHERLDVDWNCRSLVPLDSLKLGSSSMLSCLVLPFVERRFIGFTSFSAP